MVGSFGVLVDLCLEYLYHGQVGLLYLSPVDHLFQVLEVLLYLYRVVRLFPFLEVLEDLSKLAIMNQRVMVVLLGHFAFLLLVGPSVVVYFLMEL